MQIQGLFNSFSSIEDQNDSELNIKGSKWLKERKKADTEVEGRFKEFNLLFIKLCNEWKVNIVD
jgi:hypothetical protein